MNTVIMYQRISVWKLHSTFVFSFPDVLWLPGDTCMPAFTGETAGEEAGLVPVLPFPDAGDCPPLPLLSELPSRPTKSACS